MTHLRVAPYLLDARCETCGRGLAIFTSRGEVLEKGKVGAREVVQFQRCRACREMTPIRAGAYHRATLRPDLNGH